MEWLILLLLVPAIVVPVVLLFGFAGCDLVFKLKSPRDLDAPEQLEATPISVSEISLTWLSSETNVEFEIQRAPDGGDFVAIATVGNPPFVDPPNSGTPDPPQPGITYSYQVFTVAPNGRSEGSNIVSARPLAFAFDLAPNGTNEPGFSGDCVVQRISGALIKNWGTVVRIHVRGSTDIGDDLIINSIYISGVADGTDPANPNPDAWDSSAPNVAVNFGVFVPANKSQPVDLLNVYTIAEPPTSAPPPDLLISFDISANPGQKLRHAQLTGATAYTNANVQQASVADRLPTYNTRPNRLYLVEKIEVL